MTPLTFDLDRLGFTNFDPTTNAPKSWTGDAAPPHMSPTESQKRLEDSWTVFTVLRDYLVSPTAEPASSKTSSTSTTASTTASEIQSSASTAQGTADLLAHFYLTDPKGLYPLVTSTVIAMAEQIPFDHPAHGRFAALFRALRENVVRRSDAGDRENEDEGGSGKAGRKWTEESFYRATREQISDSLIDPDGFADAGEDPMTYVNMQAFLACLMVETGLIYLSTVEYAMRDALERSEVSEDVRVRDALVVGAAQFILWDVEGAWRCVEGYNDHLVRDEDSSKSGWFGFHRKRERRDKVAVDCQDQVIKKWTKWKVGFRTVAEDERYSEACRRVAERAADVMGGYEKGS